MVNGFLDEHGTEQGPADEASASGSSLTLGAGESRGLGAFTGTSAQIGAPGGLVR